MASLGGRLARVMYGPYTIAGLGTWALSGLVPDLLEDTAFGDVVKKWKRAGIDDAGEISFAGNYDPDDANGQVAINALAQVDSGLTNLYFYEFYNHPTKGYAFWRVQDGGEIYLANFNTISFAKNALATISFTGKISAQPIERVE